MAIVVLGVLLGIATVQQLDRAELHPPNLSPVVPESHAMFMPMAFGHVPRAACVDDDARLQKDSGGRMRACSLAAAHCQAFNDGNSLGPMVYKNCPKTCGDCRGAAVVGVPDEHQATNPSGCTDAPDLLILKTSSGVLQSCASAAPLCGTDPALREKCPKTCGKCASSQSEASSACTDAADSVILMASSGALKSCSLAKAVCGQNLSLREICAKTCGKCTQASDPKDVLSTDTDLFSDTANTDHCQDAQNGEHGSIALSKLHRANTADGRSGCDVASFQQRLAL